MVERIEKWDDKKWREDKKKWENRRYFDLLLCFVRGWKSGEMKIVFI